MGLTREEAKKWSRLSVVFEDHIDKIYSDFKIELEAEYKRGWKDRATQSDLESITCRGCKYSSGSSGTLILCDSHRGFMPNKACDRWEQK